MIELIKTKIAVEYTQLKVDSVNVEIRYSSRPMT